MPSVELSRCAEATTFGNQEDMPPKTATKGEKEICVNVEAESFGYLDGISYAQVPAYPALLGSELIVLV